MNCENFKDLILDYTIDDRDKSQMDELKVHLDVCSECNEFLRFANLEWKLLDKWEGIDPKEDYIIKFWEGLNHREEGPKPWLFKLFDYRVRNWSYISVLSLFLIISVVAIVYMTAENSVVKYTEKDREDEKLLFEVDRTISFDSADVLEIYGLWKFDNDNNTGG
jgi:hypothetical protein